MQFIIFTRKIDRKQNIMVEKIVNGVSIIIRNYFAAIWSTCAIFKLKSFSFKKLDIFRLFIVMFKNKQN
jgi:hypothetical protein